MTVDRPLTVFAVRGFRALTGGRDRLGEELSLLVLDVFAIESLFGMVGDIVQDQAYSSLDLHVDTESR